MSSPVPTDDPHADERLAAGMRHCPDHHVTTLAVDAADEIPRPTTPAFPDTSEVGAETLSEADFLAAGVGPGGLPAPVTGQGDDGIDLTAPPLPLLDVSAATRANCDGSHSVAGAPIAVPLEELATIGERTVRQCIQDALDSWPADFIRYVESGDAARSSDPVNTTMMMSVLYRTICGNLRDERIDPQIVWPLVLHVVRNVFHYLVKRVFEGT